MRQAQLTYTLLVMVESRVYPFSNYYGFAVLLGTESGLKGADDDM